MSTETKLTPGDWPASICVECGKVIPSGQMQRCEPNGWCRWGIPTALGQHLDEITQQRAHLYAALEILVRQLDFNPAGKSKAIKQRREDAIQQGWEDGVLALKKARGEQ